MYRLLSIMIMMLIIAGVHPASAKWNNDNNVTLAVSSCMEAPLTNLCNKFSKTTNYKCKLTFASPGHLYAHVMDGMAYDVLVSSVESYTQGLINAEKADPQSRFVLAKGRIVLWSVAPDMTADKLRNTLMTNKNVAIAIANPGQSPYGGAAREVLQGYNLWNQIQDRLVYGKNSQQAYEFVANNLVPIGFVPLASLTPAVRASKKYWEPDTNAYKPVQHEIIALKSMQHPEATKAFLDFLRSEASCQILQESGYSCAT